MQSRLGNERLLRLFAKGVHPRASKVLLQNQRGGELHPLTIWAADTDPVLKMHDALQTLNLDSSSACTSCWEMRGSERVGGGVRRECAWRGGGRRRRSSETGAPSTDAGNRPFRGPSSSKPLVRS